MHGSYWKRAASSNEFERWVYPGSLDSQQYLQDGNKANTASVKYISIR